jgi:hypothetical protein
MQTDLQDIEQTQEPYELVPKHVPFAAISKVKHIQADGVYIKTTFVPKNVKFYSKRTPDEHIAILAHGELLMILSEDEVVRYQAPASYVIPANSRIAFFTVTDCVFYCVHATQETDLVELDKIY